MRLRRLLLWLLIAAPTLAAAALWAALDGWFVATRTSGDLATLLRPHIEVAQPAGEGPFPAVVLFHGCAGLWRDGTQRTVMRDYAEAAVDEGVAAVVVDSLTPRGIDHAAAVASVCQGYSLRGRERAADVAVAFDMARSLDDIDGRRIALAGWSHGGWAIMDALALDAARERPHGLAGWPSAPFDRLAGIFLVYPYCGFPALAPGRGFARPVPVAAILVDGDSLADPAPCARAFERAREAGASVDVTRLEGVTHAFDERDPDPEGPLAFDEAAHELAVARFRRFLRDHLTGG